MSSFKLFFVAAALSLSTSVFAYPTYGLEGHSKPGDLEKLIGKCQLSVENEITAIVRFSLSDRHEIHVHAIKSEDEEVNRFLKDLLEKQKLEGRPGHFPLCCIWWSFLYPALFADRNFSGT